MGYISDQRDREKINDILRMMRGEHAKENNNIVAASLGGGAEVCITGNNLINININFNLNLGENIDVKTLAQYKEIIKDLQELVLRNNPRYIPETEKEVLK